MRRVLLPVIMFTMLTAIGCKREKEEPPKPAKSIEELRHQLEGILKDSHTPGVSVAIVRRDGAEWVAGLGLADVADHREVTPETLFRIGSTSKAFASMAILLLANQGKLSLDDPVRKLVPEVWFENRWEANDPVRVVHLLEHTTGWDNMHLREYAKDAPGMGLLEGLDYDHHSRISRWPPGTRMAYCNSGPAVAAYIVEKLAGQRFEDFVTQKLFQPIGMKTATYFQPPDAATTTLYHDDGKIPYRYWNILLRPAGAINASARDMAAYVQFYLNRGTADGAVVLPTAQIERMENPASTWAAKEGLKLGYGLGNYWILHDGYEYHGHDGSVEGGLTDMAYMPEHGVGYFFSINAGNGEAFDKIGKAIRRYVTSSLPRPAIPQAGPLPENADQYAGWYQPDSPSYELIRFLERLLGLTMVRFQDGRMCMINMGGKETFVPVAGMQFRRIPKEEAPEPAAATILLLPKDEGRFLLTGESTTMKRIPLWMALLEILLTVFVVLSVASIGVYAPFWILGGLSRKRRRPAERALRIWPLLATLSLAAFAEILILSSSDWIERFGNLTVWSALLCLLTITFALAVVAGVIAVLRAPRHEVRRGVLRYSMIVTAALVIALVYLAYWGMIGLRTWA